MVIGENLNEVISRDENFKEQKTMLTFDQLRILQKDFAEKAEILDRNIGYYNDKIQELLDSKIKQIQDKYKLLLEVIVSVTGGSHTKNWYPKIYLSKISKNRYYYWNSKHGWFKVKDISNEGLWEFNSNDIESTLLPISEEILNDILKDFSIFEIPVVIIDRKIFELKETEEISS